jgi:hypothetical protein
MIRRVWRHLSRLAIFHVGTWIASGGTGSLTDSIRMSDADSIVELRARAHEKVVNGQLPSPDLHNGLGKAGSGQKCCVCGLEIPKDRINKPSTEYTVHWQKGERLEVLRFHSDCFRAWVSLAALPTPQQNN